MSWIEKLARTYDLNDGQKGLTPIFHTGLNAHVIVTIDEDGAFLDARVIQDKKARSSIVIPCTEESASRTSGICAFPLFDSLQYIGGDLAETAGSRLDQKGRKRCGESHHAYMKQLDAWAAWRGADPAVKAIRAYLRKNTICRDLIGKGILPVWSDGTIALEKPKKGMQTEAEARLLDAPVYGAVTGDLTKTVVVFELERKAAKTRRLYEDRDLQRNWQEYYMTLSADPSKNGFCQAHGKEASLAELHPKRICNPGDNAKLISGNDSINFTYRGRFETPMEAFAVSVEASQKAHAALRWIIAKQGYHDDSQYLAVWANGEDIAAPSPVKDTADLLNPEDDIFGESDAPEPPKAPDTAEASAAALNRLIAGYSARLNTNGLNLIVLDAASPGTRAIKTYRELDGSLYLDNILNWHTNCAWPQEFSKDKRFYGAPAPRDIARAAYGKMDMDDSRFKMILNRILPCIIDGAPLPQDILLAVVRRASHPESVEPWEFRKNLGIACSLYKYSKHKERTYTMALDKNLKSRDYLYGRLLAAAEYLEYSALSETETKRPTNAMRLMAQFSERPYSTWRNLERALVPYKVRLASNNPGLLVRLEALFGEIHQAFEHDDFTCDRPLNGEYILGYYCQKADFFTKKTPAAETAAEAESEQ